MTCASDCHDELPLVTTPSTEYKAGGALGGTVFDIFAVTDDEGLRVKEGCENVVLQFDGSTDDRLNVRPAQDAESLFVTVTANGITSPAYTKAFAGDREILGADGVQGGGRTVTVESPMNEAPPDAADASTE